MANYFTPRCYGGNPLGGKALALNRVVTGLIARAEAAEALVEPQKSGGDRGDRTAYGKRKVSLPTFMECGPLAKSLTSVRIVRIRHGAFYTTSTSPELY